VPVISSPTLFFQGLRARSTQNGLERFKPGDVVELITETGGQHTVETQRQLVELVAIEPHEGRSVAGVSVPTHVSLSGRDEVDWVRYKPFQVKRPRKALAEHAMLYGYTHNSEINPFYFPQIVQTDYTAQVSRKPVTTPLFVARDYEPTAVTPGVVKTTLRPAQLSHRLRQRVDRVTQPSNELMAELARQITPDEWDRVHQSLRQLSEATPAYYRDHFLAYSQMPASDLTDADQSLLRKSIKQVKPHLSEPDYKLLKRVLKTLQTVPLPSQPDATEPPSAPVSTTAPRNVRYGWIIALLQALLLDLVEGLKALWRTVFPAV
jgi:hypothetical protein